MSTLYLNDWEPMVRELPPKFFFASKILMSIGTFHGIEHEIHILIRMNLEAKIRMIGVHILEKAQMNHKSVILT